MNARARIASSRSALARSQPARSASAACDQRKLPRAGRPSSGQPSSCAELLHDQGQTAVEIDVRRAAAALGQAPQAVGRVVFLIAIAGGRVGLRVEQQVAILGDEQEEQPIDQAQELAVVVLRVECAGSQLVAKRGVAG